MSFYFCFGHLKIHSNSLYLGHTVNSLSNAWKTHLFCTLSTIFLPFLIIHLTGSCHSPSLSHMTKRFPTCPTGWKVQEDSWYLQEERDWGIPCCRARQHSTLHLRAGSSGACTLFSEAKSQAAHITVSKIPSLRRESKTWDKHTLRTGNHMESVSYRAAWCFWSFHLELNRRSNIGPATGQTAATRTSSFEVLAHSPAAAEGCLTQLLLFKLGERGVTRESGTCEL